MYKRQEQVLTEQRAAQIQPGSAKAILTLGDGRQVALDKKPIELLVNKQQMVTGDSATLNYSIVLPASETEQIQRQEVCLLYTSKEICWVNRVKDLKLR